MIINTVKEELTKALKAKDETRLSTMRMLLAAINYDRINKMHDLSEAEELEVVRKEAKKRNDAIEMYQKAGEVARAEKEKSELIILHEFLPKQLSVDELSALIDQSIAEAGREFGSVMKVAMAKAQGRADGKQISELLRSKLQ